MALGTDYARQDCSLARTLEVVGERWTLLVLRDTFFGVRRFRDFEDHLDISKAVLTQRLGALVEAGLLEQVPRGGRRDYVLTDRGRSLWPVVFTMTQWGEQHLAPDGPRRVYEHGMCGVKLEPSGRCPGCGGVPAPEDIDTYPGPGSRGVRTDRVSAGLRSRHRLLTALTPLSEESE